MFIAYGNVLLSVFGCCLSLLAFLLLPTAKVSVGWLVLAIMAFIVAVALLYHSVKAALDLSREQATKVITCLNAGNGTGLATLLSSPSRMFGVSSLVSIYYLNDKEFEILLAHGYVSSVQQNGMIQVAIEEWEDGHEEVKSDIVKAKREELERLILKPSVARREAFGQDFVAQFEASLYDDTGDGVDHVGE